MKETELLPYNLANYLALIQCYEDMSEYALRNRYVMEAMRAAAEINYVTGIRVDPSEPDWPVVYIELPTGQVSWHIPAYAGEWDGHTTVEKIERMRRYAEIAAPSLMRKFKPTNTDSPPR